MNYKIFFMNEIRKSGFENETFVKLGHPCFGCGKSLLNLREIFACIFFFFNPPSHPPNLQKHPKVGNFSYKTTKRKNHVSINKVCLISCHKNNVHML